MLIAAEENPMMSPGEINIGAQSASSNCQRTACYRRGGVIESPSTGTAPGNLTDVLVTAQIDPALRASSVDISTQCAAGISECTSRLHGSIRVTPPGGAVPGQL